jgi:thioredoxin-like negative regulator of GroEL
MENKNAFDDIIRESKVPVLVDVFSDSCGPCIALKPQLEMLKQRLGEHIRILKVNGPHNMRFMQAHRVEAFPTLMLFNGGRKIWTHIGYTQAKELEVKIRQSVPDIAS